MDNPTVNYTSTKGLKYTGAEDGNFAVHPFVSSFSTMSALDYNSILITTYQDSDTYTVYVPAMLPENPFWGIGKCWMELTIIIMADSITPECPLSVYTSVDMLFWGGWSIPKD